MHYVNENKITKGELLEYFNWSDDGAFQVSDMSNVTGGASRNGGLGQLSEAEIQAIHRLRTREAR